jgi:hypothetical protein
MDSRILRSRYTVHKFATFAYLSGRMYDVDSSTRFKPLITGQISERLSFLYFDNRPEWPIARPP